MKENMPRTPFSTQLSGSAKETELRLRNILSGPKKRPPALFLAAMFAVCIFCGNLVSCNVAEAERTSQPGDVSVPEDPPEIRQTALTPDYQPRNDVEYALLQALFQSVDTVQPFQDPAARLLSSIWGEDYILGAALVEDHLENTLILGVMGRESRELSWSSFHRSLKGGVANVVTFQNYDNKLCLLYTFNGQENGQRTGQAGVLRFDDSEYMNWIWPVEGNPVYVTAPPDGPRGVYNEYKAYWEGHLAVAAPGGADIYEVNPDFQWGKDEPASMWQLSTDEIFYYDRSSAESLPMPVYFQALQWLNGYTNDPGGWRITGLISNPDKSPSGLRQECFTLWAQTDDGAQRLNADLYFPYDQEGARRSYDVLARAEINPSQPDKDDVWNWDWVDKFDEEWEKEQEAKQIAEYQSVGVAMDGKDYYYQGQLVNIFLDQRPDRSVRTLNQNPAGTVNVKILRADDGAITGAAYLTADEAAELAELFED